MTSLVAELNDQCTEYVQVYDDSSRNALSDNTNKAWTNRVWRGAQNPGSTNPLRHPLGDYGELNGRPVIARDRTAVPFGSLDLASNLIGAPDAGDNRQALLDYTFGNNRPSAVPYQGIPYSCLDNVNASPRVGPFISCLFNGPIGGSPYSDDLRTVLAALPNDLGVGRIAIQQLFARSFQVTRLTANRAGYATQSNLVRDLSGEFQEAVIARPGQTPEPLSVPRVFSLNPATCGASPASGGTSPATGGTGCTVGEPDNMTVNGRNQMNPPKDYNNDRIFDEDSNADGFADPIIGRNSETVNLRFFATADDNRMPIRQVSVLWGDGDIANDNTQGLYQNHKPICGNEVVGLCAMRNPNTADGLPIIPSTLTCRGPAAPGQPSDCPAELLGPAATRGDCLLPGNTALTGTYTVPRFGNTTRACNTTPFEFEHTYFCTQAMLADRTANPQVRAVSDLPPPIQTTLAAGFRLNPTDPVCVYRPRVHVRDNWGYCNGRCPGGVAGERCYDGRENLQPNECDYNDEQNAQRGRTPWTQYSGYIIVVPQR